MRLAGGVIESIKKALDENRPNVRYEAGDDTIAVLSASDDGFPVTFRKEGGSYDVGWHPDCHMQFTDEQEAFEYAGFLLSEQCRILVTSRGDFDYKWEIQRLTDSDWTGIYRSLIFPFPFWRKKRERYVQNHVLTDDDLDN